MADEWGSWNSYSDPGPVDTSGGSWQSFYDAPSDVSWQQNYDFTPDPQSWEYPLQANSSQEVADRYMEQRGGNAQEALGAATQARGGQFENAPMLRDASHDLWTRAAIQQNPIMGRVAAPLLSPIYSGAKATAQTLNPYMGHQIESITRALGQDSLINASWPSWAEMWAGMRPAFNWWGGK
jgi:hypothetical protein